MKFICDEMLAGLGRWLRAAGYDTEIVQTPMHDREILNRATDEGRLLLTRDRHFQEMQTDQKTVIFLGANSLEECIRELKHQLKINWLLNPFSRCLECNSTFVEPDPQIALIEVPKSIRATIEQLWYCPKCEKVYWQGSHTQHMLEQLQIWQQY